MCSPEKRDRGPVHPVVLKDATHRKNSLKVSVPAKWLRGPCARLLEPWAKHTGDGIETLRLRSGAAPGAPCVDDVAIEAILGAAGGEPPALFVARKMACEIASAGPGGDSEAAARRYMADGLLTEAERAYRRVARSGGSEAAAESARDARDAAGELKRAERCAKSQDSLEKTVEGLELGRSVLRRCPNSLRAAEVVAGCAATLKLWDEAAAVTLAACFGSREARPDGTVREFDAAGDGVAAGALQRLFASRRGGAAAVRSLRFATRYRESEAYCVAWAKRQADCSAFCSEQRHVAAELRRLDDGARAALDDASAVRVAKASRMSESAASRDAELRRDERSIAAKVLELREAAIALDGENAGARAPQAESAERAETPFCFSNPSSGAPRVDAETQRVDPDRPMAAATSALAADTRVRALWAKALRDYDRYLRLMGHDVDLDGAKPPAGNQASDGVFTFRGAKMSAPAGEKAREGSWLRVVLHERKALKADIAAAERAEVRQRALEAERLERERKAAEARRRAAEGARKPQREWDRDKLREQKDPYEVLGVQRDATDAQIKKAFRSLALRYHPDKNPNESENEKFNDINAAYELLSDPDAKKHYDAYGD
ncbi:hypothetical protein SO694_00016264 [Aureococcus anophagefferens]|uniref:J domain-containing protein n=2 Tax=Aureococcus anophagefferens TaxID=44056 RepID=A0ABR1G347_AURAN